MLRFMLRMVGYFSLCGLCCVGMTLSAAAANQRLGNEDLLFSYAEKSDRLVFSGIGLLTDVGRGIDQADRTKLYMKDLKTDIQTQVYEVHNGSLGYSSIAPSGTLIAVQVNENGASANPRLVVVTADGKEIQSFVQSHDFAWSPDSRWLAYTTGFLDDGEVISSGTWLYDEQLKATRKIFDKGDFVAWSPSDNSLYIWSFGGGDWHIFQYDPRTQRILPTTRRGIFVSPTGRYYHTSIPRYGEGRVEVYDAGLNQPILFQRPRVAGLLANARIVGWASEGDLLILEVYRYDLKSKSSPQGRIDTVLYDVAHDIARLIADDSVIAAQHGQVLVHDRGKFTTRSLSSLPLLPETQKLQKAP